MILYENRYKGLICKFNGNRLTDKKDSIFESFLQAKSAALAKEREELKEIESIIKELEDTKECDCILMPNPFTGVL